MPVNPPVGRVVLLSRLLVLIALGASVSEAMLSYMGLGFSGLPASLVERSALVAGGLLWAPTLASWKFPRSGFVVFALLFGTAIALCEPPISPPPGWADCSVFTIPGTIAGVFLGINLMLVAAQRHRLAARAR